MIKKRPHTAREVAAFALFSMEEEGALSDGALHHILTAQTCHHAIGHWRPE